MLHPLHIVILDDHRICCQGHEQVLKTEWPQAHYTCCYTYDALEQYAQTHQPQLAIVDIELRGQAHNGFDACRLLHRLHPQCLLVVQSAWDCALHSQQARQCGAHAFASKNTDPEILLLYLQEALYATERPFTQFITAPVAREVLPELVLSQREWDIYKLLQQMKTLQQVADELYISYDTAKTHRQHIMKKLNLPHAQALLNYMRQP